MTLKLKLALMLSIFMVIIWGFAFGALLIFDKMSVSIGTLRTVSGEHKLIGKLEENISDFLDASVNWGLTGETKFRREYQPKLSEAYKTFGEIKKTMGPGDELSRLGGELDRLAGLTKKVVDTRLPVGDAETARRIHEVREGGSGVRVLIRGLRDESIDAVVGIAGAVDATRREMAYYLLALIVFSSVTAVFLIFRIRRTIAAPFHDILRATEMIGSGDLSYRIRMQRKDEFGIVADRFDSMVADLEASNRRISRKLAETELLLDIARIAGTTLELRDALLLISETIAFRLLHDNCAVYMLRSDMKAFCVEASNTPEEVAEHSCIPVGEGAAAQAAGTLGPVFVDADRGDDGLLLKGKYRSALAVPIIRENLCYGLLVVRNRRQHVFAEDDANVLKILAHTIGSVVRNVELHLSTRKQLQKLTVLYELSRAVTSVLDLEELLEKIAGEISRLLSSRGCIIRLLEDGKLRVKSSVGVPEGLEDRMELALGEGLAGWVAENGTPLLVEDVSKMPAAMQVPLINVKSVICVPLKVGESVIGTLGVYDKYDQNGDLMPFTIDDLNTVEGFASISAIAIDKSKIYELEVMREREAREARSRMEILFDSVQGGIITLDRDYTIISTNKYVEEWVGISADLLAGKSTLDIFHEKIGICPHCAAKATFETGEINSIMQSRGVNYAELTAYPIKDAGGEVIECVVFIMDITERVLYQEETLSLYREVIQTKEYLESIIENSADAIVTTDTEGIITSWNQSAERIFGFLEGEAMGKFLPFVPESLLDRERENIEKIRKGEVLKDVEALRRRKDGTIIEVSLTLSPIKDASGAVIGISCIARDISEKKSVEKELIRRNQELQRLFFISSAMRGTLELDKLLRMVLIAVTMSDGMGFNRAILLLVDESRGVLKGAMGVGPASPEEAWKIWDELSLQKKTLEDIMEEVVAEPLRKDSFLDRLTLGIEIPLDEETVLTRAVREKRPFNIGDVREEALSDTILIQQLGTQSYAVVPLVSRDKVIGIIWVDNYFNRKPITDEDMKFLASFSNHVASAIENARLFEQVKMAEQQLENIFESMSDMVYFNNRDYVIQSVNKAVVNRIGLPASEIVGRKCYEVFHGMNEPYKKCPHYKTVMTKKAYIEEMEDPNMGGTFLTSSSPIFDLTGEFIGSVHVVRDITDIKRLQEKLVMSEKMAALGEVAAKVAHEIRNPLVSVGGFAKRLEKKLDGNLREYAGIIVKEVERLENILKEILGFVKEVRLARETVDLNALVSEVANLMESDMDERGILLLRDFGPQVEVFVDPNRVKEAVVNILSNAVQSIAGTGTISVKTYPKGNYAAVEIRDTGRGIPEQDRPYIFNPFFTTKASGTGLGLAITHRIIQEHNGMIEVESEKDRGSVFRVLLPMKEG